MARGHGAVHQLEPPDTASDAHDPRIGWLRDDEILEASPEPALDAVTRLTAIVLDVPISVICLVDGGRAWCASRHGLPASGGGREIALCRHLVAEAAPVVVEDLLLDPRFVPAVTGAPDIRFCASVPLLGPDGRLLGTLGALDHRPRALTELQLDALRLLASQASTLLELQRGAARALRAERGASTQREPEAAAPVRQGRLLVIDDEVAILKTVTRMFRSELEVVALDDPRVALRRLDAGEHFDVVLCDLTMPYLTGMQLHAAVSASLPALAARFVFLSGDLTRSDIREFLDGVPNERFEKPFDVEELRGMVRRLLHGESPSMIMR